MIILGIESSCDETGVSVFCTKNCILFNTIKSQINLHNKYGGVVPELASRDHAKYMPVMIKYLLSYTKIYPSKIDFIACTLGPGLIGSLLIGISISQAFSWSKNIPIIPINHLEGHILSPIIEKNNSVKFPFIVLLLSGGHTQIIQINKIGDYHLLGETLDDSVGEALDKISKKIGMKYPGGPNIELLSENGNSKKFFFPKSMLKKNNLNFSFSGLKTNFSKKLFFLKKKKIINYKNLSDLSSSFQYQIFEIIISKVLLSSKLSGIRQILIVGGVISNIKLRYKLKKIFSNLGIIFHFPNIKFCNDNGSIISFAASKRIKKKKLYNSIISKKKYLNIISRWNIYNLRD